MSKIDYMKSADLEKNFVNGLSRSELLPDTFDEVKIYKCALKAGEVFDVKLYSQTDKMQLFFFLNAGGYIALPKQAFNITGKAVFVPNFDKEKVEFHAGNEDLEFLHFIGEISEYDKMRLGNIHIVLPRFRLLDDAWEYTEGFTGDAGSNVKSHMVIEHRFLGRYSMGWNCGKGPTFIGEHKHPDLEQWYYIFQGSEFTYFAGDEEIRVEGGDITHIGMDVPHGSKANEDQYLNYIWFELATDGYK